MNSIETDCVRKTRDTRCHVKVDVTVFSLFCGRVWSTLWSTDQKHPICYWFMMLSWYDLVCAAESTDLSNNGLWPDICLQNKSAPNHQKVQVILKSHEKTDQGDSCLENLNLILTIFLVSSFWSAWHTNCYVISQKTFFILTLKLKCECTWVFVSEIKTKEVSHVGEFGETLPFLLAKCPQTNHETLWLKTI